MVGKCLTSMMPKFGNASSLGLTRHPNALQFPVGGEGRGVGWVQLEVTDA